MRRRWSRAFCRGTIVLAVQALAPVAIAQGDIDCAKATATAELNACADRELARADAALNAVYRKVLAKIAASDQPKPYDARSWEAALRTSQRTWIAWRDADCKDLVPFAWGGGTGTTGEVLGCLTEKTEARTKELAQLFDIE